ncbi:DUF1600 domain-containing protein [Spiroplasma sp. DGKH1]|uniref:DUF1600 domain-containing protein n=1 Tax=Spiroplasma sp. DGKH1 TaxID=3050074 RepID=UPI0034C6C38C
MLLETKKINQIWKQSYKLLFAIIGISILIWNLIGGYFDNYTINIVYKGDYNDYTINFFSTFTGWSNIMLLVWFLYAGICHQLENKRKLLSYPVALTVGLYITITFIIYNCLLVPTQGFPSDPRNVITTIFDHIINPLVFVIYVICFFENKQPVKSTVLLKKYLAKIIGFLLIYCFYAIVRGGITPGCWWSLYIFWPPRRRRIS